MHSVSLRLGPAAIAAIRSGRRKAIRVAVEQTLLREDRETSALAGFLQGFCIHVRETYVHESLRVDSVDDATPTSGKVTLGFTGDAYLGCKNGDYQHDHFETLKYRIAVARGELDLIGEFSDHRTTRDEF